MAPDVPTWQLDVASLSELLEFRAAEGSCDAAYTFLKDGGGGDGFSYRVLDGRARAIAAWMQGRRRRGDRVLLLYPAGLEFLAGFFGCLYAGVIPVPLPLPGARTGLEKLIQVQQDTGAGLALTSSAAAEQLGGAGVAEALGVQATDQIPDGFGEGFSPARAKSDEVAYLQYTSGSTSLPRGVMITHGNVLHNLANIDDGFRHGRESVVVTWLPHFHDMGLIYGLLAPLYQGIACYFMSPATFMQRPATWLEAISRYRATHSGGPNFAYDLCVRRIKPEDRAHLDLSCWEVAFNGAEPVHAETLERFAKAFAPSGFRRAAFYPAYGLAEASLKVSGGMKGKGPVLLAVSGEGLARNRVVAADPGSSGCRVLVGCGRPGRDTLVAIVDPDSQKQCASGEVGEVWVAGPGVACGYWRRPEETRETFQARLADSGQGPFLRTGDLGFLREGELFIAGRLKDLIIIRGLNHHPSDIELTARKAHPETAASICAAFSIEAGGEERLVLAVEAGRVAFERSRGRYGRRSPKDTRSSCTLLFW